MSKGEKRQQTTAATRDWKPNYCKTT